MSSSTPSPGPRQLVWIVDDNPLERAAARNVLAADYELELFTDGSAALEQLTEGRAPDVLVIDWIMPGVSGIEVCRYVRASPRTAELPVLLLTAQREMSHVVEGLHAGANDYLPKPYSPEEMRARVGALARSRALQERAGRAEASLRTLLASLPDAVLLVEPDGKVAFANEEAVRVFSQQVTSPVGARLGALLPDWDPDVAERRRGPADVAIGERFYAPLVRHVVGEDGVSITVSLRDVTETRGRETRRLDFYSMVAHDLRTPLSAMLMRVDWLLAGHRGTLQPEVRSDIVKVEARIRELVALLNDFLELARMESMGISVAPAPQDLNDLARETVEEYLPLARASSLDLQLELCPEDACADVDPRRIAQVLGNLVSNAVKFTPRGGRIVVRVSATAERVRVEVVDTGCGIAREDLPSIFGRYERGTQVAKDVGGTGLGLMIVREIVEAHGGWVTVESAVGRGSTFAFELRRVPDCGAALPQSTA